MRSAALVFVAMGTVVACFRLALILGAPLAHLTMGGHWDGAFPAMGRVISALSAGLMALMSGVVLAHAGLLCWRCPRWAMAAVLAYLALAVVAYIAMPSAAERALWLPVIGVMAVAAAVVSRGRR